MKISNIEKSYNLAKELYKEWGVDTDFTLDRLGKIPISMHCWQGDDVTGFERTGNMPDGGIQVTGNYPGKAGTAEELRQDMEKAYSLIPGKHRLNLHAIYAETGGKKIDRDELEFDHFKNWTNWAKELGIGIDFNPTFFAHPKATSGFTLTNTNNDIREFWIRHGIACRNIGEKIGMELGTACVTNIWIPDGYKDNPVDRKTPRILLEKSLNEIFDKNISPDFNLDSVESKLFGIGSESYVVGSHEFYMGYAVKNNKLICLDTGHFHPTESIADKISSVLIFLDQILLHVSRGVRWDSDHVVILCDDLKNIAMEIVRGDFLKRVHIGLDYFDASINRIAAWVTGMRCVIKALLLALLEPIEKIRKYEQTGDFTSRLALTEEIKTLPFSAVWNYYCLKMDVPTGETWLTEIKKYENNILNKRIKQ